MTLFHDHHLFAHTARTARTFLLCVAIGSGLGLAAQAAEPTLPQIYEAAQSGQMDKAQTMIQQVLIAHPNSAKAHFVQAELAAKQGNLPRAREALAEAEKLGAGKAFAQPEAIAKLQAQLQAQPTTSAASGTKTTPAMASSQASASAIPMGVWLLLGGAGLALVIYLARRNAPAPLNPVQAYNASLNQGLNGPQSFGNAPQTGYGQAPGPAYGQPYPPQGPSMGSRIMGGLATGAAIGAGMMAVDAIAKNMGGHDDRRPDQNHIDASTNSPNPNGDMGGQNFGVSDAGGWDDAGSSDAGGWD